MLESALDHAHELGWEYWGLLQCSGQLVVADPGYVDSSRTEAEDDILPNYAVRAKPGCWHVLVRRAPASKALYADTEIWELCVCHEDTLVADFAKAYDEAEERAAIMVDSGKASVVDASRRDDDEFRENVFWAKEGEVVDEAGVTTIAGYGDGAYPVFVRGAEPVDLVLVVFEWEDDEESPD